MQNTQVTCPHCSSTLNFGTAVAAGARVECLICMQPFFANPVPASVSKPSAKPAPKERAPLPKMASGAAAKSSSGAATLPKPNPAPKSSSPKRSGDKSEESGKGSLLLVLVALLLLVGGGVAFAVWKMGEPSQVDPYKYAQNPKDGSDDKSNKDNDKPNKDSDKPSKDGQENKANKDGGEPNKTGKKPLEEEDDPDLPKKPKDETKPGLKRKEIPKVEEKDPEVDPVTKIVITPPKREVPGVDQEKIDQAIVRGVDYLKKAQTPEGTWFGVGYKIGYAALGGLTFLECKVPANDAAVQRCANYVRANVRTADKNYDVATAILFLDRLGDPQDKGLIQGLSLRLLAGQQSDGGWGYECAMLNNPDLIQLLKFLQSHKPAKGKAKPANPIPPGLLPPHLQNLMVVKNHGKAKGQHVLQNGHSDNSNTQFALLALWAARRHDVPTDQAILAAYQRFSTMQTDDGGWSYAPNVQNTASNTMTCVGLLGLAMGHGISPDTAGLNDKKQPIVKSAVEDPKIKTALSALATSIGIPLSNPAETKFENLYFLWSVERVAMLYNLDQIGGKDWYGWGAQILIAKQNREGNWTPGQFVGEGPPVNTCFALLFLRRSNLVQDLTVTLRLRSGIIRDPD